MYIHKLNTTLQFTHMKSNCNCKLFFKSVWVSNLLFLMFLNVSFSTMFIIMLKYIYKCYHCIIQNVEYNVKTHKDSLTICSRIYVYLATYYNMFQHNNYSLTFTSKLKQLKYAINKTILHTFYSVHI